MEIYNNFFDFLIDFINDILELINDNTLNNNSKFLKLSSIILNEKNRIFIGYLLILISFTIYLIDNTT